MIGSFHDGEATPPDEVRAKLSRVYRFLQALDQRRNVPARQMSAYGWVLPFSDLPDHSAIQRNSPEVGWLLKVRRPELKDAPPPPGLVREWLEPGWEKPEGAVAVRKPRPLPPDPRRDPGVRSEAFEDNPERVRLLREWQPLRDAWAEAERPARRAMRVFERLYALRAQLDRESELVELMLGDGLLDWPVAGGSVRHPVLLQRLELLFDASIPEFTLVDADRPPELYLGLLRTLPDVPATGLNVLREELDRSVWHPLGGAETSAFLGRVVVQLAPRGRFVESPQPRGEEDAPQIGRSPVLFRRPRTLGFGTFIDAILEDLPNRTDLPEAIQNVIGIDRPGATATEESEETPSAWDPDGRDERILLCKPANSEQLQVAQRLARHGAVLVQGPPGTGKTHTIANLVGHLLSEGQSVLITSHTAKALQVVRQHLPEQLRPLCVSLLDESRKEMESAVEGITERLGSSDADELERRAKALSDERLRLLRDLGKLQEEVRKARADEYRPIILAGEGTPPSIAARQVREGREEHSWIPGPVAAGEPLPLSVPELADLYATNGKVSAEEETALDTGLPAPESLLRPEEFEALAAENHRLAEGDLSEGQDLWRSSDQKPQDLLDLLAGLEEAVRPLAGTTPWLLEAVRAGYAGSGFRQPWEDLVAAIRAAYERSSESQALLVGKEVILPGGAGPEAAEAVREMLEHLARGGRFGKVQLLLKSHWRRLLAETRVNGSVPTAREELEAVAARLALEADRRELLVRWEALVAGHGGPSTAELGREPERACYQFIPQIRAALDWHAKTWTPLLERLEQAGLNCRGALDRTPVSLVANGELLRLREAAIGPMASALGGQARRLRRMEIAAALASLDSAIASPALETLPPLIAELREAARSVDPSRYRAAYDALSDLLFRSAALQRRRELLDRLLPSAPMWATAVRERQGRHGGCDLPGDPVAAWRWRQFHDELERRGRTSIEALQQRLREAKDRLHEVTLELVDRKAWAARVRRTTLAQRQALIGWSLHMRRVGRGTGRRAAEFKLEAQKLMPQCQSAVPVWIMPLARVVENFDPRENRFDTIIIDEASQADLMTLSVLYMARQVVVVGDPEQVSPLAISEETDMVRGLIGTYLDGIPNRTLYDGRTSIYALAQTSFSGTVMLREHFRCVRPIIEFSNQLSYNGKIKPLRDASGVVRRPHTIAHRVESGPVSGQVNESEAIEICALVRACLELPEYDGATFGVISMVGEGQARRIDSLLRTFVSPVDYERRRLRCGVPAQFQGDERDVMFLSMVDANDREGPMALRSEGAEEMFKKRFNVAASRARDQMWVVYSMDRETDLKPDDLRRRLILHAQDPSRFLDDLAAREAETESEFERRVLESLLRRGYRVTPQWPVGSYRIDMVVEGGGKRLAVECDGDRWHTEENLQADMERQAILERLGWTFLRLRGSRFFRDPESTMEEVFSRLESLGIPPEPAPANTGAPDLDGAELRERVVRRAARIRREMAGETEQVDSEGNGAHYREPGPGAEQASAERPAAPVGSTLAARAQPIPSSGAVASVPSSGTAVTDSAPRVPEPEAAPGSAAAQDPQTQPDPASPAAPPSSPTTRPPSPVTRHPPPATRHPSPDTRHPPPAPRPRRVRVRGQTGTLLSETVDERGTHWLVLLDGEPEPRRFLVRR